MKRSIGDTGYIHTREGSVHEAVVRETGVSVQGFPGCEMVGCGIRCHDGTFSSSGHIVPALKFRATFAEAVGDALDAASEEINSHAVDVSRRFRDGVTQSLEGFSQVAARREEG